MQKFFGFMAGCFFVLSGSALLAAPWAVVADAPAGQIGMIDFGTPTPTVYGPFLRDQLGDTNGLVLDVAVTPDGKKALVSNFGMQEVHCIDISSPTHPVSLGYVSNHFEAEDIAIAPNGQFALVTDGGASPNIGVIDFNAFRTSDVVYSYTYHMTSGMAQAVAIAPDNQTVIVASYLGKIIYGLACSTGLVSELVHIPCGPSGKPHCPINIAISPDGKTVLVANTGTNAINVYRIVSPGVVVTGETPTVSLGAPVNSAQSIAFSPSGDRAYVLRNGVIDPDGPDPQAAQILGWLSINGPGNVTVDGADVARLLGEGTSQLFGVDTLAASPDGKWILAGNPTISGAANRLALVSALNFAVLPLDARMEIPLGVAFVNTPGVVVQMTVAPNNRVPVVKETITCRIVVTNTGYQTLTPVQLHLQYDSNVLAYAGGSPVADSSVGLFISWDNVGPLAIGGATVVTAKFTAVRSTRMDSISHILFTQAYTQGGFPLDLQTNIASITVAENILAFGADFDGDRKADPSIYDAFDGTWTLKLSTAGYGEVKLDRFLGGPICLPVAADFDGDGKADPAVCNLALKDWIVRASSIGYTEWIVSRSFGEVGWMPLAADLDGDRKADPTITSMSTGTWQIKASSSGYGMINAPGMLGLPGWMALAADFDGDGKADPAIYCMNGSWTIMLSGSDYVAVNLPAGFLGSSGYFALAADFDGDGLADPAVANPETGYWKIKLSGSGYAVVNLPDFF